MQTVTTSGCNCDLLVVTSTPPSSRMLRPGGTIRRFEQLLATLAKDVGLEWRRQIVHRTSALPRGPRNSKKYIHQGKNRPHDEVLEQRNPLFETIADLQPRLILTLGGQAANIVIRGQVKGSPGMNLAEDRYGLFHAPLRRASWEDKERKRAGKQVTVREYTDLVDLTSPLYPVTCTWSPGEVGMQPRLRNYFCEDIERALTYLQEG